MTRPPRSAGPATPCGRIWAIAALVLAMITIGAGWPLVARVTADLQFDYNEGWNAYRDQMAAQLAPLYGAPPAQDITNYPPLSFHLVGFLSHLTGNITSTGRILSLVSLAMVCVAIRSITSEFITSDYAGTTAALLFALWLEVWMPNRIGVNDPQFLGMAYEMAGFYCFIRYPGSGRGVETSAILFALAVFTKHNLIALPLGAGASLLAGREWRLLARWLTAGLLSAALLLLATDIIDGPFFLAHLLRARVYRISDSLRETIPYLLIFLPLFGIAAVWVRRNCAGTRRRVLALSWLAAHLTALVFSGGDGTARNIFFEAIVLDAIIVVIAFGDYFARRGDRSAGTAALLLALPMLFPLCLLPSRVSASMREWRALPQLQDEFERGAGLLKDAASPVLCENLLMCYRAGKPSAFDPFFVLDQIKMGRIDACEIVDLVENQRLGAIEIGDMDAPEPPGRVRFTGQFMQALSGRYKVVLRTPEFTIRMPADGPRQAAATGAPCVKAPAGG